MRDWIGNENDEVTVEKKMELWEQEFKSYGPKQGLVIGTNGFEF